VEFQARNKFHCIILTGRATADGIAEVGKSLQESLGRPGVMALAQVVVALAEYPQPRHVVRLHGLLLHSALLDDGDRSPDGEAVVLEERGPLQVLHSDEPRETPTAAVVLAAKRADDRAYAVRRLARLALVTVRRRRALVTHQSELVHGVDGGSGGVATEVQEQIDESGVLLAVAVEVATDPPGVTSDLERRGLYVAAALGVRRLEQRVALELEQVVPRADRRGGDGGRRDLLRRPRGGAPI